MVPSRGPSEVLTLAGPRRLESLPSGLFPREDAMESRPFKALGREVPVIGTGTWQLGIR